MRNPVNALLGTIVLCLIVIVYSAIKENNQLGKSTADLQFKIDSLEKINDSLYNELNIQNIDYSRNDLMLEKFRQKYPLEFNKYLNETE